MPAPPDPYAALVAAARETLWHLEHGGISSHPEDGPLDKAFLLGTSLRIALEACETAPPAPCPQGEEVPASLKEYIARHCQPHKTERARLRAGLDVLREDAMALASRVRCLGLGQMAGAVAADGLDRLALGMEALAEGIGTP